jgi:hypothetical protein
LLGWSAAGQHSQVLEGASSLWLQTNITMICTTTSHNKLQLKRLKCPVAGWQSHKYCCDNLKRLKYPVAGWQSHKYCCDNMSFRKSNINVHLVHRPASWTHVRSNLGETIVLPLATVNTVHSRIYSALSFLWFLQDNKS